MGRPLRPVTRRRFVRIGAASAALAAAWATGRPFAAPQPEDDALFVWRGMTLGALTQIEIRHPDRGRVARVVTAAVREMDRLENALSLYRPESALVRLNRDGRLVQPPLDLVRALSEARGISEATAGRFDVSVQPLWRVHADHFAAHPGDTAGPPPHAVHRAADLVGYDAIEVDASEIRFARAGMALTLNGIAQGYITDRIAEILKEEGFENVLVDLGEIRAIGRRSSGRPWRVGIRDPLEQNGVIAELSLAEQALATSSGHGFRFDAAGRYHHIFDPRTGACPQAYAGVSVLAPSATVADALATAFMCMPPEAVAAIVRAMPAVTAHVIRRDGSSFRIAA